MHRYIFSHAQKSILYACMTFKCTIISHEGCCFLTPNTGCKHALTTFIVSYLTADFPNVGYANCRSVRAATVCKLSQCASRYCMQIVAMCEPLLYSNYIYAVKDMDAWIFLSIRWWLIRKLLYLYTYVYIGTLEGHVSKSLAVPVS